MYSKLPVPHAKWEDRYIKNALMFFPLVGVVVCLVYILIFKAVSLLEFNSFLQGVILTMVSVLITGGIHVDGFIDTIDAISSYESMERRLEILKDSLVGAFGVIWTVLYFLIYVGFSTEVNVNTVLIISFGFIMSRSLSTFNAVTVQKARKDGMLSDFTKNAHEKKISYVACVYFLISFILMCCTNLILAIIVTLFILIWVKYFRGYIIKTFGGITGDLAGFFLQVTELLILILVVLSERVMFLWI